MTASVPTLLLIDLQRGAFDGARIAPIDDAPGLLGRARALLEAARAAGRPVIFVQHLDAPGEAFEEGTPHGEIHELVAPAPGEPVVRKRECDAFRGTDLAEVLERAGARELVLCGLQSEFCVEATGRAALDRGYGVTLAEDAHATWACGGRSAADISAAVNRGLREAGARLADTSALAAAWRRPAA